jgi:hypothetical protein
LRKVATLTPIIRANSDWDLPIRRRIALMSSGSNTKTRAGLVSPRRILPACRMLLVSF